MPYHEVLVIVRCLDKNGATKYDYYLSNAPDSTPLKEFARVSVAAHRVKRQSNAARVRPVWQTTKFATGEAGTTIKSCH